MSEGRAQRDALLLAARELGRPTVALGAEPDAFEELVGACEPGGLALAAQPELERDERAGAQLGRRACACSAGRRSQAWPPGSRRAGARAASRSHLRTRGRCRQTAARALRGCRPQQASTCPSRSGRARRQPRPRRSASESPCPARPASPSGVECTRKTSFSSIAFMLLEPPPARSSRPSRRGGSLQAACGRRRALAPSTSIAERSPRSRAGRAAVSARADDEPQRRLGRGRRAAVTWPRARARLAERSADPASVPMTEARSAPISSARSRSCG